ncbi:MAG: hypothetical protein IKU43_07680 [Clostridia bacterium]|nr:hypothetical protein [Clostridia bacterium]
MSSTDDKVIAPGTTGTATLFTIAGDPEVDVNVKVTLNKDNALKMVTLEAGTYTDYTKVVAKDSDGIANDYNTFEITENYYPVKWTLAKSANNADSYSNIDGLVNVNLATIEDYFTNVLSGDYHVDATTIEKGDFSNIIGDYKLTWNWYFDADANVTDDADATLDAADTYLGYIAAKETKIDKETFNFYLEVTQID